MGTLPISWKFRDGSDADGNLQASTFNLSKKTQQPDSRHKKIFFIFCIDTYIPFCIIAGVAITCFWVMFFLRRNEIEPNATREDATREITTDQTSTVDMTTWNATAPTIPPTTTPPNQQPVPQENNEPKNLSVDSTTTQPLPTNAQPDMKIQTQDIPEQAKPATTDQTTTGKDR